MLYHGSAVDADDDDSTYLDETVAQRQHAFGEGRHWLFKNPHFRLIHVEKHGDDNGSDAVTMTMVDVPVADGACREQLETQGYFCLSHLWGRDAREHLWNESGILTGKGTEDGVVPAVPMRVEKRATLLALLRRHPGFWWIDVFCARVSTPLVIMGSIYKHCTACFAMIDCIPDTIRQLDHSLPALAHELTARFPKKTRPHHRLPMLLVDDNDIDNGGEMDADGAAALRSILDAHSAEAQALLDLLHSAWFTRVWTLQEAVLPERLFLVAEEQAAVALTTMPLEELDFAKVQQVSERLTAVGKAAIRASSASLDEQQALLVNKLELHVQEISVAQDTYRQADALDEHSRLPCLQSTLYKFAESSRTCTDPVDFIYGVIGLLDIGLPRMTDAREVWNAFQDKFRDMRVQQMDLHLYCAERIAPFDLSQADCMRAVYSSFIRELNL